MEELPNADFTQQSVASGDGGGPLNHWLNPSLEKGWTFATPTIWPLYWNPYPDTGPGTLAHLMGEGEDGNCLLIEATGDKPAAGELHPLIKIEPEKYYTLTVWAKGTGDFSVKAGMRLADLTSGKQIDLSPASVALTGSFEPYEFTFHVDGDFDALKFYFYTTSRLVVDKIALKKRD